MVADQLVAELIVFYVFLQLTPLLHYSELNKSSYTSILLFIFDLNMKISKKKSRMFLIVVNSKHFNSLLVTVTFVR